MIRETTFHKTNICMAWLMFAIAAIVYGLTIEPTASLWDCPEFIACGYKLEIGHPPGAPIFMLVANLFSQLASDASHVAKMVNLLSALLSAGCIFFLFLTITHLAKKLTVTNEIPQEGLRLWQVVTIEACGIVGALTYTFSDTFWFSAVEAEVYAFSSFLTALMFWLILRWEEQQDDRWIILIAYITGLSIGVHLLCLLCLPAMSFVVYFRLRKGAVGLSGIIGVLCLGGLLVGFILYALIPGIVTTGGWFELLFTNLLGFPYNVGLAVYIILLTGTLITAYYKVRQRLVKLSLACILMIMAGYSSYGVIFIRANANTPMCENAPGNIFSLSSYLNREQYGYTPLFYGPAYCSEPDYTTRGDYLIPKQQEGKAVYRPSADSARQQYEIIRHDISYVYKDNMFFPRMHSQRHANAYEEWMGGVEKNGNLPTTAENLRFFVSYQVNFMYWRYFLWNFVGRQNNIQGHGEVEHGNWITGFRWIDNWLLGCDTSKMPSDLSGNKGHNVFYALPLVLGLAGIVWQWRRGRGGRQQLWIVTLLFVMTGLAIVVYLNQTPLQPRERDYAYAGSFYAFSIWIGLGVGMITRCWQSILKKRQAVAAIAGAACCLTVPLQMASQTWDDHDRSGRYTCRDFGANYLESMQREGHPIILTNGDNDTFPLWYNHEVEGVRTDTRDCNMEYLQTDWYIDQMKRPAYNSPALPISWQHKDYQEGIREYVPVRPELKEDVKQFMAQHPDEAKELLGEKPFELRNILDKWVLSHEAEMQCIPTDSVTIGNMVISLKGEKALSKNELMVLEMLSHAERLQAGDKGPETSSRPIYVSINLGSDMLSFLHDHLVLEGLAYRISPEVSGKQVDVERLYENVIHRFRYGGLGTKGVYVDEDVRRMANTHQLVMGILIDSLLKQNDTKRAMAVCQKWQQEMPPENVPYTEAALSMARCYYQTNHPKQGDEIVSSLLRRADEWLSWTETINPLRRSGSHYSRQTWMQTMQYALSTAVESERTDIYNQYIKQYEHHIKQD
ncbi:MAG: DUF2723 domain-containing protein [Prevotella sp.]|nr:DUF2723 domain-containing protein [Prevotella sp.]MBR0050222.1 DUF2723 domain-containing protein [Prevotella sp.]